MPLPLLVVVLTEGVPELAMEMHGETPARGPTWLACLAAHGSRASLGNRRCLSQHVPAGQRWLRVRPPVPSRFLWGHTHKRPCRS